MQPTEVLAEVDAAVSDILASVRQAVDLLRLEDELAHLVAERLPQLGTAILPPISELITDHDLALATRILAAMAGYEVAKSGDHVDFLVSATSSDSDLVPLVVSKLVWHHHPDAAMHGLSALARTESPDCIVSLLTSLSKTEADVPQSEIDRLRRIGDWRVEATIDDMIEM